MGKFFRISVLNNSARSLWDRYVKRHKESTLYHLSAWKSIIEDTYGHKSMFLLAHSIDAERGTQSVNGDLPVGKGSGSGDLETGRIVGVLPLILMKKTLFGRRLSSIPFFDTGGILADNDLIAEALMEKALIIAQEVKARTLDLRFSELSHQNCNSALNSRVTTQGQNLAAFYEETKAGHDRVRLILDLPDLAEELMKSFKAKLRSQIQRPKKDGLHAKIGGSELIDDFYDVFCINMRDLGSPVHSKKLMLNVLNHFNEAARIVVVYKDEAPVAGSVIIGFKDLVENPWASSLREYRKMSPNMLLYWSMLEYACDHGYSKFNFGRSSVGDGTYHFKLQWGAKPYRLRWQRFVLKKSATAGSGASKEGFGNAIEVWKRLPVSLTRIIGPAIRKHIEL